MADRQIQARACETINSDHPDAAILRAFDFYRQNWEAEDGPAVAQLREAERILLDVPATTIAGAEAKVRVAMDNLCCGRWTTEEALAPLGTALTQREPIDDFAERLLFRLTQDVVALNAGRA